MGSIALSLILLLQLLQLTVSVSHIYVGKPEDGHCSRFTGSYDCPFKDVRQALRASDDGTTIDIKGYKDWTANIYSLDFDKAYSSNIDIVIRCCPDKGYLHPIEFSNSTLSSKALGVTFEGLCTFRNATILTRTFKSYPDATTPGKLNFEAGTLVKAVDVQARGFVAKSSILQAEGPMGMLYVSSADFGKNSGILGSTIECSDCNFTLGSKISAEKRLVLSRTIADGPSVDFAKHTSIDHSKITVEEIVSIIDGFGSVAITNSTLRAAFIEIGTAPSSPQSRRPVSIKDSIITNLPQRQVDTLKFPNADVDLINVELISLHLHNETDPLLEITGDSLLLDSLKVSQCTAGFLLSAQARTVLITNTRFSAYDYLGAPHNSPAKFSEVPGVISSIALTESDFTCSDDSSTAIELESLAFNLTLKHVKTHTCHIPECSKSSMSLSDVTNCVTCPGGAVVVDGNCTCPVGSVAVGGKCVTCPAGRFAGSGTCSLCAPGTYTDAKGQTSCRGCSHNEYQPARGGTHCLSCGQGFEYHNETTCESCGVNTYQLSNGGVCIPCTGWFEKSEPGDRECSTSVGRVMIVVGSVVGCAVVLTVVVAYAFKRHRANTPNSINGDNGNDTCDNLYVALSDRQMPQNKENVGHVVDELSEGGGGRGEGGGV